MMNLGNLAEARRAARREWGWSGFGGGLLLYVVVSAVYGALPDAAAARAAWLALGLVPAAIGFVIGTMLARFTD